MYQYLLGLDLGQQNDYSVLSILEINKDNLTQQVQYSLVYLKRYALKTSYMTIADSVKIIINSNKILDKYALIIDQTGVGRPVMDVFQDNNMAPFGITITGGNNTNWENRREVKVPKRDIVSSLQVVFQNKRIKIASNLPDIDLIKKELLYFRSKISSSGHDSYSAISSMHDDIVISIGLAIWYGEYLFSRRKSIRIIGGN